MLHTRRTYSDPARNVPSWKARKYRALKADCMKCPSKAKCCPNSEARAIHREKYEIVRDFARQWTASEFNRNSQFRHYRRWAKARVFESLFKAVSGDTNLEYALIDGNIVQVHQKATGAKGGLRP